MRSFPLFIILGNAISLGAGGIAHAQVVPLLTYNGRVADPGNAESGVLHSFTIALDDASDRQITVLHVRFDSPSNGIYQVQNNTAGTPKDTAYEDSLAPSLLNYREADSHFLFDFSEVFHSVDGSTTEGNEGISLGTDGLFHGGSSYLETRLTAVLESARADPLSLAQVIVVEGRSATLTGAVGLMGQSETLSPLTFPEPAALSLLSVIGLASLRQRPR